MYYYHLLECFSVNVCMSLCKNTCEGTLIKLQILGNVNIHERISKDTNSLLALPHKSSSYLRNYKTTLLILYFSIVT